MPPLNMTHNCPDWDYMTISPGTDEMEACSCKPDKPVDESCYDPDEELDDDGYEKLKEDP